MIKKLLAFSLALCTVFMAGCQLAVPEGDNAAEMPDPMIGVFITEEYLDLFDTELWLQENAVKLTGGNTVLAEPHSEKLFGTVTEGTISFPGTEGMAFASHYTPPPDPETGSGYWATVADAGINHIHAAYKRTDKVDTVELSASIYLAQDAEDRVFYFNPIYQTADGRVYVRSGQGMSMSGGLEGEMSQKMRADAPVGPQGEEMGYSGSFDIRIKSVEVPRSVTLMHFDKDHKLLKSDTYTPDAMPQEVIPAAGAVYILVESEMRHGIQRALNQPGDGPVETFIHMNEGLCDIISTRILWTDAD